MEFTNLILMKQNNSDLKIIFKSGISVTVIQNDISLAFETLFPEKFKGKYPFLSILASLSSLRKIIERNNELFFCITCSLLVHISRRTGDDKMFLFTGKTVGLLGIWDDDTKNDFTLPNGEQIDINSKSSTIHWNFGQKCKLGRGGRPDELL